MKGLLAILLIVAILAVGCAKTEQPAQNNAVAQQATVPAQQPAASGKADIAAVSVQTSSSSFEVNDRLTIYPTVRNLGQAINGVEVGLYANDDIIKMYTFDFKAQETKGPMYEWYPDKAGKYEMKIIVDPNQKLNDNRADNQATSSVEITE